MTSAKYLPGSEPGSSEEAAMADVHPTAEERRAVAALRRLAKRWPKTLWLFAGGGSLYVMRKDAEGRAAMRCDTNRAGFNVGTVYDQDAIVERIAIEADGGDW